MDRQRKVMLLGSNLWLFFASSCLSLIITYRRQISDALYVDSSFLMPFVSLLFQYTAYPTWSALYRSVDTTGMTCFVFPVLSAYVLITGEMLRFLSLVECANAEPASDGIRQVAVGVASSLTADVFKRAMLGERVLHRVTLRRLKVGISP